MWNFFFKFNPSRRTMALGSTQSLAEIVRGIFLEVKIGRRLQPPHNRKGLHALYRDNFNFALAVWCVMNQAV
jgi:hypothetical protein